MTSISFLVPTHREDRPLARALNSIEPQLQPGDEVLVMGDTHSTQLPMVEKLVESYGPQFKYVPHDAGHHCYGHCQLNVGLMLAEGDYFHCSDDDDVWTPGAAEIMRHVAKVEPDTAILLRFVSYVIGPVWLRPGLFERNYIGGHCLFAPNDKAKIGKFACEYAGDFDYVAQTVDAYGGPQNVPWRDEIIAIARPTGAV